MADAVPEHESSEEEIKRKFREALDHQRAGKADANAARCGKDAGKVHDGPEPTYVPPQGRRLNGLSAPGSRPTTTR